MQFSSEEILSEIKQKLSQIDSQPELEGLKAKFLGPKGQLRSLMGQMSSLSSEDKREFGPKINQLKIEAESLFEDKLKSIKRSALLKKFRKPFDLSINNSEVFGNTHPLTKIKNQLVDIFHKLGFSVADGSEIETEWYCFDALNTPTSHPARDVMDTFFLPQGTPIANVSQHEKERYLLRSQTSTVQIRTLMSQKLPVRIVAPGRTFRRDTVDATHSANFHQFEGLYIDKNVSLCDLKAVLDYFIKELFGMEAETRLRPSFFPFTEPSFEVDFRSPNIGNLSNQWIEILGCGMVDPEVLKNVQIDSNVYSGFAFGVGLERIAMLKYGIDDVRLFYQNDRRFLCQF